MRLFADGSAVAGASSTLIRTERGVSFDEQAHHDARRELEKTLGATVIRSTTRA